MKLTAVTLYLNGRRYSAFVMLPADKPVVTEAMLSDLFPAFRSVRRGDTFGVH